MKTYRVGDILKLERRQVAVDPLREYQEIGVRSFGKGIFHKEPILGADLGNKRVFEIQPGDLILSNVFAWEGAVALAGPAEAGKIGSHRFMTYVVDPSVADASYLRYFFMSEQGLVLIRQASPGSAGRNRTLAIDRFADLTVPLPDLEEQRRVAARIDRLYDRLASLADSIRCAGNEQLVALYPALVDSTLSTHVTDWLPLGELVELVSDVVQPGDELGAARAFVGLQHIERHTGRRIGSTEVGQERGPKARFRPGDILYPRLRPYLNKAWLADRHGLCSVDQYVLRPLEEETANVLSHALRGRRFLQEAVRFTTSLQLPRIRSGHLLSIQVPVVEASSRKGVERVLEAARTRVVRLMDLRKASLKRTDALHLSILDRTLAGEL